MSTANSDSVNSEVEQLPKLGLVFNSNGVFNEEGKLYREQVMSALLERLWAVAVAMADISLEPRELCAFFGIEFICPDDGGA